MTELQREMLHALLDSGVTIEDILSELDLQVQILSQSASSNAVTDQTVSSGQGSQSTPNPLQIASVTSLASGASHLKGIQQQTGGIQRLDNGMVDDEDDTKENQEIYDEDDEEDDEEEEDHLVDYGPMEPGSVRDQLLR